ncbi:ArnT family glycosyltransferase [Streptomyces sp. KR80]|uniref:ArnT family glycosyltransferase n=1 Tax=Streptomyces sp. KR80 TaxID=3457426 RepID=UPI003FD05203
MRPLPVRGPAWVAGLSTAAAFALAFWAHSRVDPHYYYAAAARSMATDWHAFLYGAYDPAGTVTVDKVPGALWFQALSVRLFGFHSWALLLPQAMAFAATVPVLYSTVRRWAGGSAGAVAAVVFTLTPVGVVLARENIPDTFLVLACVCAARAAQLAVVDGRHRQLAAAGAWVGVAFHFKMGQAFLVLPALALAYGATAAGSRALRLRRLAAAGAVTVAVSALWPVLVALTPARKRPYIDGSSHDSVWEMIFQYNGLSRFGHGDHSASVVTSFLADFGGPPGAGRLFNGELGPEVSWLLPLAVVSLAAGLVACRNAPRTDPARAGWLLWGGWLLVHALVFSTAAAVHPYYTAALTPAVAALTGAGSVLAVRSWRHRAPSGRLLPAGVAGTGAWAVTLLWRADGPRWQVAAVAAVCLPVCAALVAGMTGRRPATGTGRPGAATAVALTTIALTLGPGLWAVSASGRPYEGLTGLNPVAARTTELPAAAMASLHGFPHDVRLPAEMGNMNMTTPNAGLLAYVTAHHHGERYQLAVPTANTASPYLRAGHSVLPMGGFTGAAPVPSLPELATLTASGQLRYVMTGGFHGAMGGPIAQARLRWVVAHCAAVPPALYRLSGDPQGPPGMPETLYDCAPTTARGRR